MIIPWLLTVIAITGAIYNSQGERKGFWFWVASNSGFCAYNACIGEIAMAVLFAFYLIISLNGLRNWNIKK